MQLNHQKPQKSDQRTDGALRLHSIWNTIQGEGIYAGWPATFVRLAGCNLQCPLCDTDYTSKDQLRSLTTLASTIVPMSAYASHRPDKPLIVITGGEPFRQNILPLISELNRCGRRVQVETNGTLQMFKPIPYKIICSPKTPKIDKTAATAVDAWKYVLSADSVSKEDGLPESALGGGRPARPTNNAPVYVQPLDEQDPEKNKRHTEAVVKSCMEHGYILCLQVHKFVGVE